MIHPPLHPLLATAPQLMAAYVMLDQELGQSSLMLHGSLTIGIDDPFADLDLWILSDDEPVRKFGQTAGTRFIEFHSPRKGHFQIESIDEFRRKMSACQLEFISELRHATMLKDPDGRGQALIDEARKPMRDEVRLAWFRYHYVEMRSEHRACDNCIERTNSTGLLLAASRALQHAMQAASVLDGEPYRYSKWLTRMTARGRGGAKVVALVTDAVWLISAGALLDPGPEANHRLNVKLKEIRTVLIDAARASGIDEPWLRDWYLHIDKARQGVDDVRW